MLNNSGILSPIWRLLSLAGCPYGFLAAALLAVPIMPAAAAVMPSASEARHPTDRDDADAVNAASGFTLASLEEFSTGEAVVRSTVNTESAAEPVAEVEDSVSVLPETATSTVAETADLVSGGEAIAPLFRVSDLESAMEADSTVPPRAADVAQATRVTDFSDVLPSDWAFQALSNLVENYGCIQGYPDRTFRGQRSLTRFEFAAGLNACLDVIVGTLSTISDEDLVTIRRLQEEFAVELAGLEGRVDGLEAEVAELTAQQFATQTKLRGSVFAHIGSGFANGPILAEGNSIFSAARDPGTGLPVVRTIDRDPGTTVGSLAWINLDTSFTGEDRLKLQLVAGSGVAPGNLYGSAGLFNTFGVPFTFQTGGTSAFDVTLRELSYLFPVGDSLTIDIGPRINWYSYFDNNRYTFFLTGGNTFNSSGGTQVNTVDRGAGVIAVWDITDWLDIRVGYLAESTEFLPGLRAAEDPTRGLFGGTSTLTGQIGISPFDNLNLRFLYTRSNLEPNAAGQVGGTLSEPIYGFADDGFGGPVTNAPADTFLVNFDWTPLSWLGLFGRYSYGSTELTSAVTRTRIGDINAQSFQFGLAFPNLFKEGALATVSYLVPFDVTSGRNFLVSGGGDGGTQQEVEVSYRYPLNRNISLMPSFYWIINPNNFGSNPDIFLFNLQGQISF
ncbi:MAG: iron uptake porin [Leptolyngbyaceae cyanobacterium SM2_5_2]|nr:iron uptake porin [Leptolyngbyaceae cyanobacterium SM2_5_2]